MKHKFCTTCLRPFVYHSEDNKFLYIEFIKSGYIFLDQEVSQCCKDFVLEEELATKLKNELRKKERAAIKKPYVNRYVKKAKQTHRVCKVCQKNKERRKINPNKYKYVDEEGKYWHGLVCGDCFSINRYNKPVHPRKCNTCASIFNPKKVTNIYCSKRCRVKYKPKPLKNNTYNCKTCNIKFNATRIRKYCSPKCKGIKKEKITCKLFLINCISCNVLFSSSRKKLKCRPRCGRKRSKSENRHRKFRKQLLRCNKQKISKTFKKELMKFYDEKPSNTHVDHIIPLKHPNVCGLHVPWNLQYLSPEENMKKSNNWDGTYENEGWRKI